MRPDPPPLNPWRVFVLFLLLGFWAYGQTLSYPFVHDDIVLIQQNPRITDWNLREIFMPGQSPRPGPAVVNTYYRPVLEIVYRLQYLLFDLNPAGYHLVNVLLHILNSLMVYLLAEKLTAGRKGFSLGLALLFLLHPIQSEAVACVAGISNLLFAFLGLTGIYLYLISRQEGRGGFYALSLAAFLTALLAKEQAVILPFLILFISLAIPIPGTRTFGTCPRLTRLACPRLAGYFALLGGYFILRKWLLGSGAALPVAFNGELVLRLLAVPRTLLMYVGLIFFPKDLHYYRNTDILQPFAGPFGGLAAAALVIALIIRRVAEPHRRLLVLGLGWFFICLLPVLNIIPLINEYSFILTAEHFLYLPMMGVLLFMGGLCGFGLRSLTAFRQKIVGVIGVGLLSLIFLAMTVRQNTFWADEVSLFERTVRFEREFGRGHILLAQAYYGEGRFPEAISAYQKALDIMHGYLKKTADAQVRLLYAGFIKGIHFDLAHCFEGLGDFRSAVEQYQQALAFNPLDDVLHNNLGAAYMRLGETGRAGGHFKEALRLNSHNRMALHNLASCYLAQGQNQKAISVLRQILDQDPRSAFAADHLRRLSAPDFHDIK